MVLVTSAVVVGPSPRYMSSREALGIEDQADRESTFLSNVSLPTVPDVLKGEVEAAPAALETWVVVVGPSPIYTSSREALDIEDQVDLESIFLDI